MKLNAANRSHFTMNKGFASSYCSDMQPILIYTSCETWLSTRGQQENFLGFERKILEKIYGAPDTGIK